MHLGLQEEEFCGCNDESACIDETCELPLKCVFEGPGYAKCAKSMTITFHFHDKSRKMIYLKRSPYFL